MHDSERGVAKRSEFAKLTIGEARNSRSCQLWHIWKSPLKRFAMIWWKSRWRKSSQESVYNSVQWTERVAAASLMWTHSRANISIFFATRRQQYWNKWTNERVEAMNSAVITGFVTSIWSKCVAHDPIDQNNLFSILQRTEDPNWSNIYTDVRRDKDSIEPWKMFFYRILSLSLWIFLWIIIISVDFRCWIFEIRKATKCCPRVNKIQMRVLCIIVWIAWLHNAHASFK